MNENPGSLAGTTPTANPGGDSAAAGQNSRFSFNVDKYALLKRRHGDRYVEYRRRWSPDSAEGSPDFPLEIGLIINTRCNLRCSICPLEEWQKSGDELMSAEVMACIEREATEHEVCSFDLCGSEPFLHVPTFLAVMAMVKRTPAMDLFVHTNGTMFSDATLDVLVDPRVTTLNVSVDAATAESYAAVRGKPYFDRIRAGLERVAGLKAQRNTVFPLVQLSFCVNPLNFREADRFEESWRGLAQSFQFQSYLWRKGINLEPTADFRPDKRDFCREPDIRCLIMPNGDMYPCCAGPHKELLLGNIMEHSIATIWRGEKIKAIRDSLRQGRLKPGPACADCLSAFYRPCGE